MNATRPMPRLASIALLAILAGLATTGRASACEMMDDGGCAAAMPCGCCGTPATADPVVSTASLPVPIEDGASCRSNPSGRCICGDNRPAAPEPRPGEGPTDHRNAPGRDLGAATSGLLTPSPKAMARSFSPSANPPQRTPLYLRTSRLLI